MNASLPVSVGLILLGAVIMAAAIFLALRIRKDVSRSLRPRWLVTVSLMFFFLLGYIGLVLMLALDVSVSRDLLVGAIFFGGACFVYLVMSLTRTSLADIRWRTDSLIEVNEELEAEIAERRRAEDGLRHSQQYLSSIIDTEPECVMLLGRDGTVLSMNAAGLEMLETGSAEDIIGSHIQGMLPPGHKEPFLAFMERIFQGERESLQFKVMGFKGRERWLETHAVPFRDERRGETLMLAVTRDITTRKRAEGRLRESEQRYRNLFSSIRDVIIVTDARRMIEDANQPALRETFGYELEDVAGRDARMLYADEEAFRLAGREIFDRPGPVAGKLMEADFRRKDGDVFRAEMFALKLLDEHGDAVGNFGVIRDVTERKKLEQQLQQAQKMEALGTLTGGVAHEFNNVMTAILGFGELILEGLEEDHPLRTYVNYIVSSAQRAARLTEGLLAFSRKQITHPEPVDINHVILLTEGLLSNIAGETITLECRTWNRSLPVVVDKAQMEQALVNLATNAIDAMPQGGRLAITSEHVRVDAAVPKTDGQIPAGEYALITVADTGTGMDEKTVERIFEPFFTTKDVGRGTGLGLSMVYGTIRKHGGHILVRSAPDRGTTFRIYLPISRSRSEERTSGESVAWTSGTETVLIAEDDDNVRNLLSRVLGEAGYRIIEAVDGVDAVEKFREQGDGVDLLLLDLVMPRRNGKAAYEDIARICPGVKAVFITGYARDDIRTRDLVQAGHTLISKPISPRDILARVRECLDSYE